MLVKYHLCSVEVLSSSCTRLEKQNQIEIGTVRPDATPRMLRAGYAVGLASCFSTLAKSTATLPSRVFTVAVLLKHAKMETLDVV